MREIDEMFATAKRASLLFAEKYEAEVLGREKLVAVLLMTWWLKDSLNQGRDASVKMDGTEMLFPIELNVVRSLCFVGCGRTKR